MQRRRRRAELEVLRMNQIGSLDGELRWGRHRSSEAQRVELGIGVSPSDQSGPDRGQHGVARDCGLLSEDLAEQRYISMAVLNRK